MTNTNTNQSLSTRAMLVNLSITSWTARKYDKKITADVAQRANTTDNVGRYNKNLLPIDSATYKAVQQAANAARTAHYEQTLPWSDEGSRILPATNYLEYTQRMRGLRSTFDSAVQAFIQDYPSLQANAQRLLNGLYNADDYPTAHELQDKFSFATKVLPLPDATDFRVMLGDDDVDSIRKAIEADVNASISSATSDLYQRLFTAVSRMTERLSDSNAVFRDSLVMNVREICELIPRLNLTNDPELDAISNKIDRSLAQYEPEDLRTDKPLRAAVAKMAAKIQGDMAAFMGVQS